MSKDKPLSKLKRKVLNWTNAGWGGEIIARGRYKYAVDYLIKKGYARISGFTGYLLLTEKGRDYVEKNFPEDRSCRSGESYKHL